MDPASILGVIGVVAQILKAIQRYGDGVVECGDEVARLRIELFCLKSALAQIESEMGSFSEADANSPVSTTIQSKEFGKVLQEARSLLLSLARSLQEDESRARRLAKRLAWPLKRQHVKDLATGLERLKTYFILVATNDTRQAIRESASSLLALGRSLEEIKIADREKSTQSAVDGWLTTFDPSVAHSTALAARYQGTNGWFLDGELKDWAKGGSQLLWLKGMPGSGKTCIAAACVSRILEYRPDVCVAYFYCSYNEVASQRPQTVVASLVKQLYKQVPHTRKHVVDAYDKSPATLTSLSRKSAEMPVLAPLFIRMCGEMKKDVVLIIDAIDECSDGAEATLQVLFKTISTCPRVRLVLTSTESMTSLVHAVAAEFNLSPGDVELDSSDVRHDIDAYLDMRFRTESLLSKLRPQLQTEIKDKIKSKHNGSFRWAQCTVDDLAYLATPRAIKEALRAITPSLSDVYMSVVTAIPPSFADIAHSMLMFLVSARRQLTLDELAEATVISSSEDFSEDDRLIEPEAIVRHLRCLVRYEPMTRRVELAHSSVREFLVLPERSGRFYVDPLVADRALCRACIEYLLLPHLEHVCPDNNALEERMAAWPFLEYASSTWSRHVRHLQTLPDDIKATVSKFVASADLPSGGNFAAWFQCVYPQGNPDVWATKPLYMCGREGLVDLLKVILPTLDKSQLEQRGGTRGSTALHVAAAYGETECIRLLLAAGADPNERNTFGESGIQWAHLWGHAEAVQALLEGGADPDLIRGEKWTWIHAQMQSYIEEYEARARSAEEARARSASNLAGSRTTSPRQT